MRPAGASLRHPVYGLGKMIEVQGDGRRHVTFGDTGEVRVFASRSGSEEGLSTMPIFNLTEVDATLAEQAASNKSFARTNRPFSGSSREWHLPEATVASSRHSQFDTLLSKALTLTVVWNRPKVRCNDSLFRTIVVMPPASKRVRPLVMPPAPQGLSFSPSIPSPIQLARKVLSTMLEGSSVEVGTRDEVCAPRVIPCRAATQHLCLPSGGGGAAAGTGASAW